MKSLIESILDAEDIENSTKDVLALEYAEKFADKTENASFRFGVDVFNQKLNVGDWVLHYDNIGMFVGQVAAMQQQSGWDVCVVTCNNPKQFQNHKGEFIPNTKSSNCIKLKNADVAIKLIKMLL